MKSLLEFLLIHLVNNPDDVRIETSQEENTDVYTIFVAPEDTGRVIGKGGKIIHAIRTLAKVRAVKEQKHIMVRVGESEAPQAVVEDVA